MAEKNIAAFLRPEAKTIGVRFIKDVIVRAGTATGRFDDSGIQEQYFSDKEYTYVTDLQFDIGDVALVFVFGLPRAVLVTRVDDELNIEPNGDRIKWIAARVDLSYHQENEAKNKAIEDTMQVAYRHSVRTQYRNLVLSQLPADAAKQLGEILGVNTESKEKDNG